MRKAILVTILAVALAGCAAAGRGKLSYEELYAEAENEIKIAQQMGYLWRDTKKILGQSKQAHEKGEKDKAMKLVNQALDQAKLAQQQAKDQANPEVFYPPI